MDDSFISVVVGVGKQRCPSIWQIWHIYSKTMVLWSHETSACAMMCAWLVVTSITIPAITVLLKLNLLQNLKHHFYVLHRYLKTFYLTPACLHAQERNCISLTRKRPHVKGKDRSKGNTKIGKERGKILTRNEKISWWKAQLKCFDNHRCLSQSGESKWYIYSLLIEENICNRQNVSVKLSYVFVCLSSRNFIFSARVSSFFFYCCVIWKYDNNRKTRNEEIKIIIRMDRDTYHILVQDFSNIGNTEGRTPKRASTKIK